MAPCLAQNPAAHQHGDGRMPADSIVAFAKLSMLVSEARDSIQFQLALPRNKTLQMQQQLRDQLAARVAEILQRAGISDAEFQRKTYLVSTDSAARAVFDSTVSKLSGAPIPGQTAAAAPVLKVPAGPVGVHLGHIANAFSDTPRGMGLLPAAMAEARTAAVHANLAARDPQNLDAMKLHAGHVLNAVDPTIVATGPGLGYGVKRAALGVASHIELAAKAQGASPNVATHAAHIGAAARNTVVRADRIVAVAKQIQASTDAASAAALVSQLVSLTAELLDGKDANADGRVGPQDGEAGLRLCEEHLKMLLAAELPADR
jgi:hypothetical protein